MMLNKSSIGIPSGSSWTKIISAEQAGNPCTKHLPSGVSVCLPPPLLLLQPLFHSTNTTSYNSFGSKLAWYSDRSFPLEDPGLDPDSCRGAGGARGGVRPAPPGLSESILALTQPSDDTQVGLREMDSTAPTNNDNGRVRAKMNFRALTNKGAFCAQNLPLHLLLCYCPVLGQ